eukprot:2820632-Pyramimonas_sp.AAC.1
MGGASSDDQKPQPVDDQQPQRVPVPAPVPPADDQQPQPADDQQPQPGHACARAARRWSAASACACAASF